MSESEGIAATERLWGRAMSVLAAGRWSVTDGVLRHPGGAYPLLARSGEGWRLLDTTGREYVDWIMGWGPVVLGHRHPAVESAIRDQLTEGPLLSLLHPIEIEVAERLRELVPCCQGVAFGKNGSDVLAAAVRIARAKTGREKVLVHGYHGFHDWFVASVQECRGFPESLRASVERFTYNDLDGLRDVFEREGQRIAAVVMEPTNVEAPGPGFLEGVRELTREHGTVLVFDEVITSFRIARGGAQEAFGVLPDLACVGKALANGMPLSALCGPEEFLLPIAGVGYGLTYRGETLSLAAALATLRIHDSEPVAEHLRRIGERLVVAFDREVARVGIAGELRGFPARTTLSFAPAGRLAAAGLQTLFVQRCLEEGVLTNGSFLPSYAHDDESLDRTARAFALAADDVARARDAQSFEGLLRVPPVAVTYGDSTELVGEEGAAEC